MTTNKTYLVLISAMIIAGATTPTASVFASSKSSNITVSTANQEIMPSVDTQLSVERAAVAHLLMATLDGKSYYEDITYTTSIARVDEVNAVNHSGVYYVYVVDGNKDNPISGEVYDR